MTVTLRMARLLELKVVPRTSRGGDYDVCTRCSLRVFPRRLWNCRGLQLVYKRVCIECVRWVGSRWLEHFEILAMREWARDLGEVARSA